MLQSTILPVLLTCAVAGCASGLLLITREADEEASKISRFIGAMVAAYLAPAVLLAIGNSTVDDILSGADENGSSILFLFGVSVLLGVYSRNLFTRLMDYMDQRFDEFLAKSAPFQNLKKNVVLVENVVEESDLLESDQYEDNVPKDLEEFLNSTDLTELQERVVIELAQSTMLRSDLGISQSLGVSEDETSSTLEELSRMEIARPVETTKGVRWRLSSRVNRKDLQAQLSAHSSASEL